MPPSSLRPKNREAQRCGHRWSRMPMRPEVSRNAIRRSPSSIRRTGSPSVMSSDDRHAGSQYWRIMLPIGVPGPTLVSNSFSLCEVMFWCLLFGVLTHASTQDLHAKYTPVLVGVPHERRREIWRAAGRELTSTGAVPGPPVYDCQLDRD